MGDIKDTVKKNLELRQMEQAEIIRQRNLAAQKQSDSAAVTRIWAVMVAKPALMEAQKEIEAGGRETGTLLSTKLTDQPTALELAVENVGTVVIRWDEASATASVAGTFPGESHPTHFATHEEVGTLTAGTLAAALNSFASRAFELKRRLPPK